MTLQVLLLGSPQLIRDGRQIEIPGYRPWALFAYLLLTGKPQSREYLANLLFDGPDDPRASLRWTLSQLRKAVGADAIHADRQQIGFNFAIDYWLDVTAFEAGELDHYRGELLAGLSLRDAHQYDAWLLAQRERLRALYQADLEERLRVQHETEDAAAVEQTALQLLQLDNLREEWHRALISAYAQQGKFEAAQAQYELCQTILQEELDTEPSPATAALAEAITQEQVKLYGLMANHSDTSFLPANGITESRAPPHTPIQRDIEGADVTARVGTRWSWPRIGIFGAVLLFLLILVFALSIGSTAGSANRAAAGSGSGRQRQRSLHAIQPRIRRQYRHFSR